jgi:hypothetical protein
MAFLNIFKETHNPSKGQAYPTDLGLRINLLGSPHPSKQEPRKKSPNPSACGELRPSFMGGGEKGRVRGAKPGKL